MRRAVDGGTAGTVEAAGTASEVTVRMERPGRSSDRPGRSRSLDRRARSALDLGPGLDPVVEALALDVRAAVEAGGLRRGPVPDLVPVGLIGGVVQVAVARDGRERARLRVRRRLAEVLGDLDVDLGRGDVLQPEVGTVHVLRLRVD